MKLTTAQKTLEVGDIILLKNGKQGIISSIKYFHDWMWIDIDTTNARALFYSCTDYDVKSKIS